MEPGKLRNVRRQIPQRRPGTQLGLDCKRYMDFSIQPLQERKLSDLEQIEQGRCVADDLPVRHC